MIDLCELLFARGLPKGERLTKFVRHTNRQCDVCLITDMSSGRQYVGSAYGAAGILGRWSSYAQTRHGGNRLLEDLLQKNPDAVRNFQFSILRVMPTSMTRDEVVASEVIYKLKLSSRAHGLNLN